VDIVVTGSDPERSKGRELARDLVNARLIGENSDQIGMFANLALASGADPEAQVKTLIHALIYSSKLVSTLLNFAVTRSSSEALKDAVNNPEAMSQLSEDEKLLWSAMLSLEDRSPDSGF
jgi:hypothetical protein